MGREEAAMIGFSIGLLAGGIIGIAVTCMCVAASERTESACAEAYEQGKRDGKNAMCKRMQCPAYERFIERGE